MNKLQIRVDRADAELMFRALTVFANYEVDAAQRQRATKLAKWLDHRITQYYGVQVPPGNTSVTPPFTPAKMPPADHKMRHVQ